MSEIKTTRRNSKKTKKPLTGSVFKHNSEDEFWDGLQLHHNPDQDKEMDEYDISKIFTLILNVIR